MARGRKLFSREHTYSHVSFCVVSGSGGKHVALQLRRHSIERSHSSSRDILLAEASYSKSLFHYLNRRFYSSIDLKFQRTLPEKHTLAINDCASSFFCFFE